MERGVKAAMRACRALCRPAGLFWKGKVDGGEQWGWYRFAAVLGLKGPEPTLSRAEGVCDPLYAARFDADAKARETCADRARARRDLLCSSSA